MVGYGLRHGLGLDWDLVEIDLRLCWTWVRHGLRYGLNMVPNQALIVMVSHATKTMTPKP